MFLKAYLEKIKDEPLMVVIGLSVFALAVTGTSVRHASSAVYLILFLSSFIVIPHWKKTFMSLSGIEKLFLLSLFLYLVSAGLSYYNTEDVRQYNRLLERFLRFALFIPVYLLFVRRNISLMNYLYAGAVFSGFFIFIIAIRHYSLYPDVPAQGYYHHIIFGQLAMLNVGIMLSLLLSRSLSRALIVLVMLSMVGGISAAMLSQARGVWLVLPAYVLIALFYSVRERKLSARLLGAFLVVIIAVSALTPISDVVRQRTDTAVDEISRFYSEDQYRTSVGTRLAMWDIALDVWKKHPVVGTGPADFDDEIMALQQDGRYVGMDVHNSTHNIYMQALAGTGVIGFIMLLLAVIILPLRIFLSSDQKEAQIAGIVTIVSFAIFGLSESWTLRLSITSVFLVYTTVIATSIHVSNKQGGR